MAGYIVPLWYWWMCQFSPPLSGYEADSDIECEPAGLPD